MQLLYFVVPEKLLSLLPEYVVPYMIHLLAHDPDFTKPQDVDQLRDIKEYVSSSKLWIAMVAFNWELLLDILNTDLS